MIGLQEEYVNVQRAGDPGSEGQLSLSFQFCAVTYVNIPFSNLHNLACISILFMMQAPSLPSNLQQCIWYFHVSRRAHRNHFQSILMKLLLIPSCCSV